MPQSEENHYPDPLRSEEMSMIQLFVPTEVAHDTVHALGVLGIVQFRDLNPNVNPSQRAFVGEIRRFEEIGRQIRFFTDHIRCENDEVTVRVLEDTSLPIAGGPLSPQLLEELEETIRGREVRLTQMNDSCQKLAERKKSLLERISVLHETVVFFDQPSMQMEVRNSLDQHSANTPLLLHGQPRDQESQPVGMQEGSSFTIGFVAGVIERSRASTLERILWRSLRGNLFMKYLDVSEPFDDPVSGSRSYKSVFIVFVSGDVLSSKVAKICDLMGASLYPITSDSCQRSSALQVLTAELEDTEVVLSGAVSERRDLLRTIAWEVNGWEEIVRREKKIYEALNLFDYDARRRTLIADGWAPTRDIPTIQMAIHIAAEESGSDVRPVIHKVRTTATPPTFFRTNKFTESFQTIMDSYGTAAYQEINGGLFSIVTLPFMFAVMFGDVGHAGTILLAAIWMIRNERTFMKAFSKSDYKELIEPFFVGRYIILIMGGFSLYTGLIYNDFFSRSLHVFGSSGWSFRESDDGKKTTGEFTGHVYPFGLDPGWHGATNRLVFVNSYKMKMSIILGLAHMTFALCLQIPNHLRFKRRHEIYLTFLPQILFLYSIIGYLVFCIFLKWSIDWSTSPTPPPSIMNLFIAMFLQPTSAIDRDSPYFLYRGQAVVQRLLLCVAVLCVPVIFGGKPLYIMWKRAQSRGTSGGYIAIGSQVDTSMDVADGDPVGVLEMQQEDQADMHNTDHDMSELLIHQVIHTIEFCLNCISHTASYLRLWALSLAHAQLTEVLWGLLDKFSGGEGILGWVVLFGGGLIWFSANVAILCILEGLSAFLHALRLHWVEGNSKHFEGGGYPLKPFSFVEEK